MSRLIHVFALVTLCVVARDQGTAADRVQVVVDGRPSDTVVLVAHDSVNRVILLHALGLGEDPRSPSRKRQRRPEECMRS